MIIERDDYAIDAARALLELMYDADKRSDAEFVALYDVLEIWQALFTYAVAEPEVFGDSDIFGDGKTWQRRASIMRQHLLEAGRITESEIVGAHEAAAKLEKQLNRLKGRELTHDERGRETRSKKKNSEEIQREKRR